MHYQGSKPSQVQHSPRDLFKTPTTTKRTYEVPKKYIKTSSEPLEEPMHWEISHKDREPESRRKTKGIRYNWIKISRKKLRTLAPLIAPFAATA